jgi:hypothetical protein
VPSGWIQRSAVEEHDTWSWNRSEHARLHPSSQRQRSLFAVVKPFTVCLQNQTLVLAASRKSCRGTTFIFCPRQAYSRNSALGANSLKYQCVASRTTRERPLTPSTSTTMVALSASRCTHAIDERVAALRLPRRPLHTSYVSIRAVRCSSSSINISSICY